MDFWLFSQGFSGWVLQWLKGKINSGYVIVSRLWLNSFWEGVFFDGFDKLLVSQPSGFSLWLFFEHEQHLAVAVGVKRGMGKEGKESLVAIRTAVGAGPGLNFVQNHWAVKPSQILPPLTPVSLLSNLRLCLRGQESKISQSISSKTNKQKLKTQFFLHGIILSTTSYTRCFEAMETPNVVVSNIFGRLFENHWKANVHKNVQIIWGVQVKRAFHGPLQILLTPSLEPLVYNVFLGLE